MHSFTWILKLFIPEKAIKATKCLKRFDNAYDDVIKLLPEQTVGNMIKQIPDKRTTSV